MDMLWTGFKYYMMYVTVKKFFTQNPEQAQGLTETKASLEKTLTEHGINLTLPSVIDAKG